MTDQSTSARIAWLVLALISIANFGNFYVYDSIGPVADLLQHQRQFSDSQIGWLNAIYSLPNVVLILVGGVMVDRLGAARMLLWTAAICFVGSLLTAVSPDFGGMAAGRLLFGIGAETLNICTLAAIVKYFPGRHMAFAVGLSLAIGRAGAYSVYMSPTWFTAAYAAGWQSPLVIAAALAAASLAAAVVYRIVDRRRNQALAMSSVPVRRMKARDLARFPPAFWYLLALCVLWYAVIFAFRSTFAVKYFQHVHGLDLAVASEINGFVDLAAIVAVPVFGWLCDRTGRYAPLLAFGAFLLPGAIATMAMTGMSLWVGTVLIGISYALVPAVMWPLVARLVHESRLGTAIGLMWVVQNAGIAGANLAAGWLNDSYGASAANPAGYDPMLLFFFVSGALGFGFALLLWLKAGRKAQEQAMVRR